MTTVVEGAADGTVVTVVRVRLREAATAMTTQMTMGMITKITKLAIDTPTPIPTKLVLVPKERKKNNSIEHYKWCIANQHLR